MANLTDVFQFIACMPNLPEKELKKSLGERVIEILGQLNAVDPSAKQAYLTRLASRARHHKRRVDTVGHRLGNMVAIDVNDSSTEQDVRDFFHDAYYGLVFVTRYALISSGSHDCTEHKAIGEFAKNELPKRNGTKGLDAAQLCQSLSECQAYRNIADYIMNNNRLSVIAIPQIINTVTSVLAAQYASWNLPC